MKLEAQDNRAVSPVVGSIIMVAMTVMLASIIGSFVLDLGDNASTSPHANVEFAQDSDAGEVTARVTTMENADHVTIAVHGGEISDGDCIGEHAGDNTRCSLENIGDRATVNNLNDGDRITVVGYKKGEQRVLKTYTFRR